MKILEIREATVPMAAPMRSTGIHFGAMTASVVALITDRTVDGAPVIGFGCSSIGRYAHGGLLRERFVPRLAAAAPERLLDDATGLLDPRRVQAVLMEGEKPGGHGERCGAVGVIDAAVWDAVAKARGVPLWRVLAERRGASPDDVTVPVYASGGHYRDDGRGIAAEVADWRERGFTRGKIKAGGAPWAVDAERIETAADILGGHARLAVDAGGALGAEDALALAVALDPLGLAWIEEAGDPLDYSLQAKLAARFATPFATGENLFSVADARNLLRHGGLRPERDWLQFDVQLAYGLTGYLDIVDLVEAAGWSRERLLPHAGHLLALHAAAGLGLGGHEMAADDSMPYGGTIDGAAVEDGAVSAPGLPGIGYEGKASLWRLMEPLARGGVGPS